MNRIALGATGVALIGCAWVVAHADITNPTGVTSAQIIAAMGYTPLNPVNGSVSGAMMASGAAATNMGFTPMNGANNGSEFTNAATVRSTIGAGTGNGFVTSVASGTGLAGGPISTTGTLTSNAEDTLTYAPGLITAITSTFSFFTKIPKASTVDNLVGSALTLNTCSPSPVIELDECGSSTTCTSPTAIGAVTLSSTGTAVVSSLSSTAIAAGDYVAWRMTTGTCVGADIGATAEIHAN